MSTLESAAAKCESLPPDWRWVRLGEVCQINPRRQNGMSFPADRPTTFVPMSAVNERSGRIAQPEMRPFADVQRGYTYFEEGDVLFAKITPCMQNGKHAIARNLAGGLGFGTTEFHVLRPGQDITSEWVHYFLRQPTLLEAATEYFTGAVGQQRLPPAYLAELLIPLPPRQEQERLVATLTERLTAVERARSATEAQLEVAKALLAAYLRKVFDSPEAKQWPTRKVAEICRAIDYGFTASADFSLTEPRFLRITDIQNGGVIWDRVPGCRISAEEEVANKLIDGDIVFARTGATTGKSFLLKNPPRAVFASYLIRLRPAEEVVVDYLYAFFQSDDYWRQIRNSARGGAQPNVNATLLGEIMLPVPPLSQQRLIMAELSAQIASAESLRQTLAEQLETVGKLPVTILRRAFSGAL